MTEKTLIKPILTKPIKYEVWLEYAEEPLGVFDTREEAVECKCEHQWRYISRTVYIKEVY